MEQLTIGRLAREAGVGVETIRFYERTGLLVQPKRAAAGFRKYNQGAVRKLRFIKRAQALGFSLKEVKELLALSQDPDVGSADFRKFASDKIADIAARIADLKRVKAALAKLTEACPGHGPLTDCPILAALERPDTN
jgi:MerR family copper efflux transcriptional regulator